MRMKRNMLSAARENGARGPRFGGDAEAHHARAAERGEDGLVFILLPAMSATGILRALQRRSMHASALLGERTLVHAHRAGYDERHAH